MTLGLALLLCQAAGGAGAPGDELDAARLELLTAELEAAVARGDVPGAVCVVGRGTNVAYQRAVGSRAVEPAREPMTLDTVFDCASLTKPVVTATCAVSLVQDGKLRLDDRVVRWIPEFAAGGGARDRITVEMLLTHRAGFAPDDPLGLYTGSPDEIFARKRLRPLESPPGERFTYSDVGFEELARVLEAVEGKPLDVIARERVFVPLDMRDAHFRRLGATPRIPASRIAPTERVGDAWLRGVVHDPRARALDGVAGHAGLFATGSDLASYCVKLLTGGGGLTRATVADMTRPRSYGDDDLRALGWDVSTRFSGPRGALFPRGSFGHTGFTGTSMWLDPTSRTFVLLLTSYLHPNGEGRVVGLRAKVATLAASAVPESGRGGWKDAGDVKPGDVNPGDVEPGADVLRQGGYSILAGKRVALVTNPTGRLRDGASTIDVLTSAGAKAAGVKLVRLFAPEHGLRGDRDERIADGVDARTGLTVKSLYGESRRPAQRDLTDLDAVVVDLQDAGCRFYTYLATVGYCLEECAKAGVGVVVLDRPNPIGADRFEGPLLDASKSSFVGYHALPVRTGLTIGEAARLFNAERKIGARLTVVAMRGYTRDPWYDGTGLAWVNPSPNLRSVTEAALYPALCLLEFTNVSVGRGTDAPFEQFGAPWLDGVKAAAELARRAVPGVRFTPVRFTPEGSVFAGEACGGVRVDLTDRGAYRAARLGFEIATYLRDAHADAWDETRFPELLGNDAILAKFRGGASADALERACQAGLDAYASRRARFLLYPEPKGK